MAVFVGGAGGDHCGICGVSIIMLTLIKQAELYAPQPLGRMDLLIGGGKIIALQQAIELESNLNLKVIDARGHILAPGLVDSLVHITGGGGEGGFTTRTPEMQLTDATLGGVTTVIGALGTDACSRNLHNLLGKVSELRSLGLNAYCYTGSYQFPVITLLGNVRDDLILLDSVIGVGEVAIADHRASHMTVDELVRMASEARVGGMLSGKAGIVSIHLGDGREGLSLLWQAVARSEVPASQFYPTHINRQPALLEQGIEWAKQGGYIDFTTSTTAQILAGGEIAAAEALAMAMAQGVPEHAVTMSSDGNASLPQFDDNGRLVDLQAAKVKTLHRSMVAAHQQFGLPLAQALAAVTRNPAQILNLKGKGCIKQGYDADLLLMEKDSLAVSHVWSQGQLMVESGTALISGNFE